MHSGVWDVTRLREALDAIMRETGLSGRALARLGGFGESQVGRWRDGKTRPSYDVITKLGATLAREYPDLAGQAARLITAAGYSAAGVAQDSRPAIVREHWDDDNVRDLWKLKVGEAQRLSFVEAYLTDLAGERATQLAR